MKVVDRVTSRMPFETTVSYGRLHIRQQRGNASTSAKNTSSVTSGAGADDIITDPPESQHLAFIGASHNLHATWDEKTVTSDIADDCVIDERTVNAIEVSVGEKFVHSAAYYTEFDYSVNTVCSVVSHFETQAAGNVKIPQHTEQPPGVEVTVKECCAAAKDGESSLSGVYISIPAPVFTAYRFEATASHELIEKASPLVDGPGCPGVAVKPDEKVDRVSEVCCHHSNTAGKHGLQAQVSSKKVVVSDTKITRLSYGFASIGDSGKHSNHHDSRLSHKVEELEKASAVSVLTYGYICVVVYTSVEKSCVKGVKAAETDSICIDALHVAIEVPCRGKIASVRVIHDGPSPLLTENSSIYSKIKVPQSCITVSTENGIRVFTVVKSTCVESDGTKNTIARDIAAISCLVLNVVVEVQTDVTADESSSKQK